VVQTHVERAGPSRSARWLAMEELLSKPMLPGDLRQ